MRDVRHSFLAVVLLLVCGMASASARVVTSTARNTSSVAVPNSSANPLQPLEESHLPPNPRNGLFVANNPVNLDDPFGRMAQLGKQAAKRAGGWVGKKPSNSADWDEAEFEPSEMFLVGEEMVFDGENCCIYKLCNYEGTTGGHGMSGGGRPVTNSSSVSCDGTCPPTNGKAPYGFDPPSPPPWNINNTGAPTLR
jgi:hypothetical protein